MTSPPAPRAVLIAIADLGTYGEAVIERARAVARDLGPAVLILERDKTGGPDRARLARLERLARACGDAGAGLVVGARADLAASVGAFGVQLPEDGLPVDVVRAAFPGLAIGRSCHDRAGLVAAAAAGVDWALLSPLHAPTSKASPLPPLGLAGFRAAVAANGGPGRPVYALGGVTAADMAPVLAAGGAGLAAIGAVFGAADPVLAARALVDAAERARDPAGTGPVDIPPDRGDK